MKVIKNNNTIMKDDLALFKTEMTNQVTTLSETAIDKVAKLNHFIEHTIKHELEGTKSNADSALKCAHKFESELRTDLEDNVAALS